jgi:hypothetical protein
MTLNDASKEVKGNYYRYAASLRASYSREKRQIKVKLSQDVIKIETATNALLKDKVDLINIRKLRFADFAMVRRS